MTVKWIGDAAQELGLSPLDAVEILASRQEYPMNGLLDEDRFKTLRLMRGSKRLETSGSQPMPVPDRLASPSTVPIPTPPQPARRTRRRRPGGRRRKTGWQCAWSCSVWVEPSIVANMPRRFVPLRGFQRFCGQYQLGTPFRPPPTPCL